MKLRLPGAPGRAAVVELRAGEREDEDRVVPRPLEQVLDEVEQAGVGPLHVLEHHARPGTRSARRSKKSAPRREHVLLVARDRAVLERRAGARAAARPTGAPPASGTNSSSVARSFAARDAGSSSSAMRQRILHHVDERPVRDALAVGQAAAAVPQTSSARPSTYFSNSHDSRDLPIPAIPVTETSCGLALLGRGVEQLLDQPQLAVAARRTAPRARSSVSAPSEPATTRTRAVQARPARPCPSARARPRPRRRSPASEARVGRLADEDRPRARRPTGSATRC